MSILFLCLPSKKDAKGQNTIFCRVTIDKERCQFSTNINIMSKNWVQKKQAVKTQDSNAQFVNILLSEMKNKISRLFLENSLDNIEDFKKMFFEEKHQQMTVNEIITSFLQKKKLLIDKDKKLGGITLVTFNSISKTLEHLSSFCGENAYPNELDNDFIKKYHQYLIEEKKFKNDYIVKCLQIVKTILNHAIELKELTYNPLAFTQLPKRSAGDFVYLTSEEKDKLEQHHFHSEKLKNVQDLFLFQCYTGFAYIDMCNFSNQYLFQDGGKLYIKMKRQKTEQEAIIPFFAKAQEIWEKYNEKLPIISNQKYNAYLKEVAGVLEINKKLTTHVARKSFAMLSLNAGVSMEAVSRCLGHSDIRTTQKVYAKVNETRILREFDNIEF